VRAVLDVNVLVSAALSARGIPAEILRRHRDGAFELVTSDLLITELVRTLTYPKIRKRIPAEKASAYVNWVRDQSTTAEDPPGPSPVRSPDPDDDYLLALAIDRRAVLVTGDQHLLGINDDLPIVTPATFIGRLDARP
jgi:putative PIN family toxin of toxin-antitoxin system